MMINECVGVGKTRKGKKKKYEKYTLVNRTERVKKFPFIVETTVFQYPVVQLHGN